MGYLASEPGGGGGGGTVTSVGLALPASVFSVAGSPVIGAGTLTGDFISQNQNLVFASPDGLAGTPTFRALVEADIPALTTYVEINGDTMTGLLILSGDPVVPLGAATKQYVDSLVTTNLSWKNNVVAATTGVLPANTYNNGALGVGATITANANGVLPNQDGVALINGDRFLVKNETGADAPNNGIYVVTDVGSGGTPFILTRVTDCDVSVELHNAAVGVVMGTVNANRVYFQSAPNPVVGTDDITWVFIFSSIISTDGQGIEIIGNQLSLELDGVSLEKSAAGLKVNDDIVNAQYILRAPEPALPNSRFLEADVGISFQDFGAQGPLIVSAYQPTTWAIAYSDFIEGNLQKIFQNEQNGAGAAVTQLANTASLGNNWGVVNMSTGTTATGRSAMAETETGILYFDDGSVRYETRVYIPILSTAIQRFILRLGFNNSLTTDGTNGVYFRYSDNINGGNWQYVARNGGVESVVNSGIIVAAGQWYKLGLTIAPGGIAVDFDINGVIPAGQITTNIPTTGATRMCTGIYKSIGATARTAYLDYIQIYKIFSSQR